MAQQRIFSVKDERVGAFMQPFYAQHPGQALRSWEEICNDEKSNMYKYPGEFALYELGEYNEATAEFILLDAPKHLASAVEYKRLGETHLKAVQ